MEPSHEHDWRVTAEFRSERLDEDGFVVDFIAARAELGKITGQLENTNLNDLPICAGRGASAERVAQYIAVQLGHGMERAVHCVRVTESPGCQAAFYPKA